MHSDDWRGQERKFRAGNNSGLAQFLLPDKANVSSLCALVWLMRLAACSIRGQKIVTRRKSA